MKPIQTQVSEELYEILKYISSVESKSVAQLLRELLDTLTPGLREAQLLMMKAQSLHSEALKAMIPEIERHGKQLEQNVEYGIENIRREINKGQDQDPPQYKLPIK